jgi:hypothetical protein
MQTHGLTGISFFGRGIISDAGLFSIKDARKVWIVPALWFDSTGLCDAVPQA